MVGTHGQWLPCGLWVSPWAAWCCFRNHPGVNRLTVGKGFVLASGRHSYFGSKANMMWSMV